MSRRGATLLVAVAVVLLAVATAVRADTLAYVRASSQAQPGDAERFHPIHLLDDDPKTIWCEGADGVGEDQEVRIFFKRPQKIDRVVITPAPQSGRLVQMVELTDDRNTVRVRLDGNQIIEQPFSPPMEGEKFTVTIRTVGAANSAGELPGDVACLADVMLFLKKRPFGGRIKPGQLRYNVHQDRVLGVWNGEPMGAPEKFLTFALDGTWQWRFEPLMDGRRKKLSGEYRFRGNRLLMRRGETGRWSDVNYKHRKVAVNPNDSGAPLGDYQAIRLNAVLGEELAGEYNNAEF